MGKPTGFLEHGRHAAPSRPPEVRVRDWQEWHLPLAEDTLREQAGRCMDCGVPFCHTGVIISGMASGCPLTNLVPEWNDLVYRGQWQEASIRLHRTNNFPEFTGRVCPAPCEGSCVLGINDDPVTIKSIEQEIADRAWDNGWIVAEPPLARTGFRVAVVGSGPAGLAAAAQLNHAGHLVTVLERADRIGGLMTYGIPNMKLDKGVVERRVNLLAEEGIQFRTGVTVGIDLPAEQLLAEYDAVVLATGSTVGRDLAVEGRDLGGIHMAVEYLHGATRHLLDGRAAAGRAGGGDLGQPRIDATIRAPGNGLASGNGAKRGGAADAFGGVAGPASGRNGDGPFAVAGPAGRVVISAAGRDVLVLGGGDTGTDCVATAIRQGARSVRQLEILPRPPETRAADNPWPEWPKILRVDYGQEEAAALWGADPRRYAVSTRRFLGEVGRVSAVEIVGVTWVTGESGRPEMWAVPGTEEVVRADLVLLALGFLGPEPSLPGELGCELDARGNVRTDLRKMTSVPGIFAAGDCSRGQSLVVWAIREGRAAANGVDRYLMHGESVLPA